MAIDAFIKIKDIAGESQDAEHKNEIEVLSWEAGVGQQSSMHTGSGGGAGRATVRPFSFTHFVDCATPNLFVHCASGKHIDEVTFTARRADGEKKNPYLTIVMKKVVVSDVQLLPLVAGNDIQQERVMLSASAIEYTYTPQGDVGGNKAKVSRSYDIKENKTA